VSWCWTQCFPQAPDFDPGGWVKVQFGAPSPDQWRQVEDHWYQAQSPCCKGESCGGVGTCCRVTETGSISP
ncbi:hypothetical protein, partial [Thiolapillus sp.]|uniref:hypothetical protein n=1 Tax=Thiolapillus sp. TaxID=2017437 RepID=UPI003AF9F1F8